MKFYGFFPPKYSMFRQRRSCSLCLSGRSSGKVAPVEGEVWKCVWMQETHQTSSLTKCSSLATGDITHAHHTGCRLKKQVTVSAATLRRSGFSPASCDGLGAEPTAVLATAELLIPARSS